MDVNHKTKCKKLAKLYDGKHFTKVGFPIELAKCYRNNLVGVKGLIDKWFEKDDVNLWITVYFYDSLYGVSRFSYPFNVLRLSS